MYKVRVLVSALKHDHSTEDITYASYNYEENTKDYSRLFQSVHVRIGATSEGVMLEMIAAWDERENEWRVFYAMRPKKGLMRFMRLEDRHAH